MALSTVNSLDEIERTERHIVGLCPVRVNWSLRRLVGRREDPALVPQISGAGKLLSRCLT